MNKCDEPRFVQIMLGMADNFRDTITKEGMLMRFEILKAYSIDQVTAAAKKIMATRKYTKMPPIAEFIEAIEGGQPRIEDRAEIQAAYVISCIGQGCPRFDDPVTAYLMLHRWRWSNWAPCVLESELKWWSKDFKEAYRAFSGPATPLQIGTDAPPELQQLLAPIGGDSDERRPN
jgi:hypothetical protein